MVGQREERGSRAASPRAPSPRSSPSRPTTTSSGSGARRRGRPPRRAPGSAAVARGPELAAVLAQLGRDERVAEEAVELVLGREAVHLARLDHGDAVLRDGQPAALRVLAQRDVVVLRAREVLEQAAVVLGRHDAQVEPEPLLRHDGRLRVAVGGDLEHPRQLDEVREQRGRVGRGRDHVEVAEGLASPPHAAGGRDLDRRRVRAERLDDVAHDRQALRRAARAAPARGRSPSRAPRGSAPRSSRRAPGACARVAAPPPRAARRASSRRARARSGPRSSGRDPGGGGTASPRPAPRRAASRAPTSRRSRSARRSSPRSSRRSPTAPSPSPRARARRSTSPSPGSASPRGGTRAREIPARRGSPRRRRGRRARRRRPRCGAARARADHRDGLPAGGAGRLPSCRPAPSSACRPTTSGRTSSRSCGRSARCSTRPATACS